MLHSFQRHQQNDQFSKYVLYVNKQAISFLKKHKNIVILPADKGNVTVAMMREDYDEKMSHLLSDRSTYWRVRQNPTTTLQARNNNIVKWLHNNKIVDDREKTKMTTYTAQLPSIYGLPKIHKRDVPMRPIISSMKLPCYELSKFVGRILQCVTNNSKYTVRNSFEFVNKAKKINIKENEVLVSFDVISLFTNIPTQFAINLLKTKWTTISKHTKMTQSKFLEVLDFCLKENNYLQYKTDIYKQIFGMPMGNPLSPTIADIVMDHLLDQCFDSSPNRPSFIAKYVDDIFAIIDKNYIDDVLQTLNKFHSKLQFTVEHENNCAISFLDVKIIRNNNKLKFDWFQKDTCSGRLTNFRSNHAKHIKINTAYNMIHKVLTISDEEFHQTNERRITNILRDNGYPNTIIRELFLKHKYRRPKEPDELPTNNGFFNSVTYIPKLTDNFKQAIQNNIQDIRLAFKSNRTLGNLFSNLKAKTEKDQQSDVIYKINCKGKSQEPCNLCYIGTTKQLLRQRLSNHKSDIKSNNPAKTALALHAIENGHHPDFDGAEVLQTEKHISKRYTLETLHILNNKNNMNRKQDTQDISSIYCYLISSKP